MHVREDLGRRLSDEASHWDDLWEREVAPQWDNLSEEIFSTLSNELGALQGLRLLEAGSGSGRISLRLAEEGAHVTLVDFSSVALAQSRERFNARRCPGAFIQARVEQLPVAEGAYDAVWNAGVLEHYSDDEQVRQLRELFRVLRPGGRLVVFAPAASCLLYQMHKWFAKMIGVWRYGYERGVESLADKLRASGFQRCREYTIAFDTALDLASVLPGGTGFASLARVWYRQLPKDEASRWPGYLLVSVADKPGHAKKVVGHTLRRKTPDQSFGWGVILLSSIDYGALWQRPQHLAREFARLGCASIYVEAAPMKLTLENAATAAEAEAALPRAIFQLTRWDGKVAITKAITHAETGETAHNVLDSWLGWLTRLFGIDRPLIWVMHPAWGQVADVLRRHGFVVYDCVDEFSEFSDAPLAVLLGERELLRKASMVTATAEGLASDRRAVRERVHLLPNGVSPQFFGAGRRSRRMSRARCCGPVLGFVGALAQWVDTELVGSVARIRPDWRIVLVGPALGAEMGPLKDLPNVIVQGPVDYAKVPSVLAQFDVGMVPFRINGLTNKANPVKVYEYLAAGLPVVATPFDEAYAFGDLVQVAGTPQELVEKVGAILASESEERLAERVAFAEQNRWDTRARLALALAAAYDSLQHDNAREAQVILRRAFRSFSGAPLAERELAEALRHVVSAGRQAWRSGC